MIVGSNLHGPFPAKVEEALWYDWLFLPRPDGIAVPVEPYNWAVSLYNSILANIDV